MILFKLNARSGYTIVKARDVYDIAVEIFYEGEGYSISFCVRDKISDRYICKADLNTISLRMFDIIEEYAIENSMKIEDVLRKLYENCISMMSDEEAELVSRRFPTVGDFVNRALKSIFSISLLIRPILPRISQMVVDKVSTKLMILADKDLAEYELNKEKYYEKEEIVDVSKLMEKSILETIMSP